MSEASEDERDLSVIDLSDETLRRLAKLVEDNDLSELRFEQGDLRVTLRTGTYQSPNAAPVLTALPLANLPAMGGATGNPSPEAEPTRSERRVASFILSIG